jgi:serine/threonine protein kinase
MNIGPYQVLGQVGRGGMGVVFKALDPRSGETVAIKMLNGIGALDRRGRCDPLWFFVTIGDFFRPWGWGYCRFDWGLHVVIINNAPWRRT